MTLGGGAWLGRRTAAVGESLRRKQIHEDFACGARDTLVLVVLHLGAVDVVCGIAGAVVEQHLGVVERPLAVAEGALGLGADGEDLPSLHRLRVGHTVGIMGQRYAGARDDLPVSLERAVAAIADVRSEDTDQKQGSCNQYPPKSLYRQPHRLPGLIFSLRVTSLAQRDTSGSLE